MKANALEDRRLITCTFVLAAQGDSNVIDLCRVPLTSTGDYAATQNGEPTYYRALIDTGPNLAHLANVQRVLTTFGQPKVQGTTGTPLPIYEPNGFDNAVLGMFQVISHFSRHETYANQA